MEVCTPPLLTRKQRARATAKYEYLVMIERQHQLARRGAHKYEYLVMLA